MQICAFSAQLCIMPRIRVATQMHLRSHIPMHMKRLLAGLLFIVLATHTAMAIDVTPLWGFSKPELSEQRFRAALETAECVDALILQTQIARTHGLRKDFAKAQAVLATIEPQTKTAGHEARARYALNLGRTYVSTTHPRELQNDEAKARARTASTDALAVAKSGELDALTIMRSTCLHSSTNHPPNNWNGHKRRWRCRSDKTSQTRGAARRRFATTSVWHSTVWDVLTKR